VFSYYAQVWPQCNSVAQVVIFSDIYGPDILIVFLHQLKAVLAARQPAPALQVIDAVTFQQSGNQGPVLMNQLIGKDNPLRWALGNFRASHPCHTAIRGDVCRDFLLVTNRLRCIKKWILVTDITSISEFL
jgi:hypothetical protein